VPLVRRRRFVATRRLLRLAGGGGWEGACRSSSSSFISTRLQTPACCLPEAIVRRSRGRRVAPPPGRSRARSAPAGAAHLRSRFCALRDASSRATVMLTTSNKSLLPRKLTRVLLPKARRAKTRCRLQKTHQTSTEAPTPSPHSADRRPYFSLRRYDSPTDSRKYAFGHRQ
jgi:hypothetical protein